MWHVLCPWWWGVEEWRTGATCEGGQPTSATPPATQLPSGVITGVPYVRSGTVSVIVACQHLDREATGKRLGKAPCDSRDPKPDGGDAAGSAQHPDRAAQPRAPREHARMPGHGLGLHTRTPGWRGRKGARSRVPIIPAPEDDPLHSPAEEPRLELGLELLRKLKVKRRKESAGSGLAKGESAPSADAAAGGSGCAAAPVLIARPSTSRPAPP